MSFSPALATLRWRALQRAASHRVVTHSIRSSFCSLSRSRLMAYRSTACSLTAASRFGVVSASPTHCPSWPQCTARAWSRWMRVSCGGVEITRWCAVRYVPAPSRSQPCTMASPRRACSTALATALSSKRGAAAPGLQWPACYPERHSRARKCTLPTSTTHCARSRSSRMVRVLARGCHLRWMAPCSVEVRAGYGHWSGGSHRTKPCPYCWARLAVSRRQSWMASNRARYVHCRQRSSSVISTQSSG